MNNNVSYSFILVSLIFNLVFCYTIYALMGNPTSEYITLAYTLILIPFIKNMFLCCNQNITIHEVTLKRYSSGEGVGAIKTRVVTLSIAMLLYSGVLMMAAPIEVFILYTLVATVSYVKVCLAAASVVNYANA